MAPLAVPRCCSGTYVEIRLELVGKTALSPAPSNNRNSSKAMTLPAKPVSKVATDHRKTPMASTRCAPNRSVAQPTGTMNAT